MKIFDCFPFFNEYDILKIRFKLLDPYVDYFVLVEANRTLRGDEKPYYFEMNKEKYCEYEHKIIHIKVDDLPIRTRESDYSIEMFQRDAIMRGLAMHCQREDIVIISDVDEIINPTILENIANVTVDFRKEHFEIRSTIQYICRIISNFDRASIKKIIKYKHMNLLDVLMYSPVVLQQSLHYYFLNYKSNKVWNAAVISQYGKMLLPQEMRRKAFLQQFPYVKNAGWHFSYMGGVEAIKNKLKSIVDEEDVKEKMMKYQEDDAYIRECIETGVDIFGREIFFELVDMSAIRESEYLIKEYSHLFYHSEK